MMIMMMMMTMMMMTIINSWFLCDDKDNRYDCIKNDSEDAVYDIDYENNGEVR